MKNNITYNMLFSFGYQIVTIAFGVLLPRVVLSTYGASAHGTISTINNTMNYVMLLSVGLSTAAMQALYKPFTDNDSHSISSVLNTIRKYYRHTAIMFFIAILGVALLLPTIIKGELSHTTVTLLVFVMGMQYVFENVIINTEKTLLQADNRLYFINFVNSISYILRGIIQLSLMLINLSLLFVMMVPVILVIFRAIYIHYYVRRNYNYLDTRIACNDQVLSKRKNAFIHQISGVVLNNTDVITLSIFWNQTVVSKYSIYSMVFSYLYLFISQIFSSSVVAFVGKSLLNDNNEKIQSFFSIYELSICVVSAIIYSTASVMILPFVGLYTRGIIGVLYVDPTVSYLFVLFGMMNILRIPGLTFVDAAGLYKETQHQAIVEMIINLAVSITLCPWYGIVGVLIGTVASFAYRTVVTVLFVNKMIIHQVNSKSLLRMAITFTIVVFTQVVYKTLFKVEINSWHSWILVSVLMVCINCIISIIVFYFVSPMEIKTILKSIKKKIIN